MAPERPSCPRCESRNTKFCYYNNYNLSQPRHFCKSCRRYWTLGGSLRNIPAGGTSRKNAAAAASSSYSHSSKRRRVRPSSSSAVSSPPSPASPVSDVPNADGGANGPAITDVSSSTADISGTFAGLLAEPLPLGLLALGDPFLHGRTGAGFNLDIDLGLGGTEEMGFELGSSSLVSTTASAWPFLSDEAGEVVVGGIGDTWNVTAGEAGGDHPGGGGDGGFFTWGNPAVSTPEKNVQ